ncbi:alkaline phosphatase [Roseiconus nitratireducens]|uniref:Alkaline phosphatase n=1 Tax=Roseiconus nitratireducens TaxID=2605748 RepID=A0A5M6CYC4_9BACT|nr:alkaline phosphatase D family protein [Roseiconus nitratireducens]KAA5539420.1 alkaline phosphatase [Roseiconus nitratireducens]
MLNRKELVQAIRSEGGMSRRLWMEFTLAAAAIPTLGLHESTASEVAFADDPFSLGVASGDPDSTSVVLWTRLAPEPLTPYGGMPAHSVPVRWQVAEDQGFTQVVRSGTTLATPQLGHSVHQVVQGLKPDHWYWYRFLCGDAESPIGRTRTMPRRDVLPEKLRFAFASCQNYEQGLYTAYESMAQEHPDLVFFLGDYIYEYEAGRTGKIRSHLGAEIESLGDYRIRYSQYRSDPLLKGMHAQCPWFLTWDDHEFDNNCACDVSEERDVDPLSYLQRRANAYQAYYEMMPLRPESLPRGPHMQLYRQASFGRLANFAILDTRQYRTDQPNDDRKSPLNEAACAVENSLLGSEQRGWLRSELLSSQGTWNVLAQQVMMGAAGFRGKEDSELNYSMDQWPGAYAERGALLEFMRDRRVPNPIVLTGDIHSNWVNDLRIDDREGDQPVVATEFVATSISSGGNGVDKIATHDQLLADNPGVRFHNAQRGYVLCTVTPKQWVSDYVVMDQVTSPGGKATRRASFTVESGTPGVQ